MIAVSDSRPLRALQELISKPDEEIDLAEAALLIAAPEYPDLDTGFYLGKLDEFAAKAGALARVPESPWNKVEAVATTLFGELGFRGNIENYYDPRNSFLNEVIERRTGIPITLSVLFIEVAKRLGVNLQGVGMPAHFLVKFAVDEQEHFFDPFNAGSLLSADDCVELLGKLSDNQIEFRPDYLSAVTKKQILSRMLANLRGIHIRAKDYERVLTVIDQTLILDPDSPDSIRDRAVILIATGRRAQALPDLERYLKLSPRADDRETIIDQIKAIRREQARWN